jgi:hypothetical protein
MEIPPNPLSNPELAYSQRIMCSQHDMQDNCHSCSMLRDPGSDFDRQVALIAVRRRVAGSWGGENAKNISLVHFTTHNATSRSYCPRQYA